MANNDPITAVRKTSVDIRKWFDNGDRPDEWKIKEWCDTLDSALRLLGDGEPIAYAMFGCDGKPIGFVPKHDRYATPVYASPVPPAVVVPGEIVEPERRSPWSDGWNACLAEIKRLNPERTNG